MSKPTLAEFEACQKVLEFMQASITEHEPFATNDLNALEYLLSANTFSPADYEAVTNE